MPAWDPAGEWPPPGTPLTAAEVLALDSDLQSVELIQAEGPLHVLLFSPDLTDARSGWWEAYWYPQPNATPLRGAFYPSLAAAARAAAAAYCTIWCVWRWHADGEFLATKHYYPLRLDPVRRRDAGKAVQAALEGG